MLKRQTQPTRLSDSQPRESELFQPSVHYVRDNYGRLKYVAEVDLSKFDSQNIRVRQEGELVIIETKRQQHTAAGVMDIYQLRYDLRLPGTVLLPTVKYALGGNGKFRLEGLVKEAIRPPLVTESQNRQSLTTGKSFTNSSGKGAQSPTILRYDAFADSIHPHRPIRATSPVTNIGKRVSFLDAQYNDNHYRGRNAPQHVQPPKVSSKLKNAPNRKGLNSLPTSGPGYSWGKSGQRFVPRLQSPSRSFNLRVAVGENVQPEDVSVTYKQDMVIVSARKLVNGIAYTHHSEHSLPGNIDPTQLKARVENGYVMVGLPYHSPSPIPSGRLL